MVDNYTESSDLTFSDINSFHHISKRYYNMSQISFLLVINPSCISDCACDQHVLYLTWIKFCVDFISRTTKIFNFAWILFGGSSHFSVFQKPKKPRKPQNFIHAKFYPRKVVCPVRSYVSVYCINNFSPSGVFEMPKFAEGTISVMNKVCEATKRGVTTVIGQLHYFTITSI